MTERFDVVIVGGGIIGAACADRLAGEGHKVCLIEAREFLREASWAAPGVLHPIHPFSYPAPLHPLLRAAPAMFPPLAADLLQRTGIDVGLETPGLVVLGDQVEALARWCGEAIPHQHVRSSALIDCPADEGPALFLPEARTLRPARLGHALLEGARRRGAELRSHTPAIEVEAGQVRVPGGIIEADTVVMAAGAWSGGLCRAAPTEPVRGQMLLYDGGLPHMVIFSDRTYVTPRRDGRVLFGSTVERAGFDGRPTEQVVARLQERAETLLGLHPSALLGAWAGLRPGTPSGLPHIGRDDRHPGLIHAMGHYRTGVILAPLTAEIVADLVAGRAPRFVLPRVNS